MTLGLARALLWVKTHWKWLLFPVGALLWFLGRSGRRPVVVRSSEAEGQAKVEVEASRVAFEKIEEARAKRASGVSRVEREVDAKLQDQDEEVRRKAEELENDPEALNDFLKSTGRDVRGK